MVHKPSERKLIDIIKKGLEKSDLFALEKIAFRGSQTLEGKAAFELLKERFEQINFLQLGKLGLMKNHWILRELAIDTIARKPYQTFIQELIEINALEQIIADMSLEQLMILAHIDETTEDSNAKNTPRRLMAIEEFLKRSDEVALEYSDEIEHDKRLILE